MKHWPFLFLIVILLSSANAAAEKMKIGVVIPLSGTLAEYGIALKNGFLLAEKNHSKLLEGVEFIYEDSRYDNTTAVSIVNKLAASGAASVVYVWGYGPCQAVAPVAQTKKIPVLAATGELSAQIDRDFVLRFSPRIDQYSQALIGHMRSRGWKKIGIIAAEIAYMRGILQGMQSNLNADETIEEIASFQMHETDFRPSIERMKLRQFDAVGVFLVTGQVNQFYKQAHSLKLQVSTFGTSPFENREEIRQAGGLMDGAVFPGVAVSPAFERAYLSTYGNDVQLGWAATAYDFALLSGIVANRINASEVNGLAVLSKYREINSVDVPTASIVFDADAARYSRFEFPLVMRKIHNNEIFTVKPSASD